MKITYDSNNSGGSWWLTDQNWIDLEKAGWEVVWGGKYFCHSKYTFATPEGRPEPCASEKECSGHRKYESYKDIPKDGRYMGALAKGASKDFDTAADAIREFEKVTGLDASDNGCGCCGPPHNFNWGDYSDGTRGYVSGEEIAQELYPSAKGLSYKELAAKADSK